MTKVKTSVKKTCCKGGAKHSPKDCGMVMSKQGVMRADRRKMGKGRFL